MFEEIPDYEFKNLTRSTLPLLAWWKNKPEALSVIGKGCGFSDLANASVCFEFSTASAGPHDKASYTDVMIESLSTAIAIEGKWTEPRYETVSKWSQQGNIANRKKVLAHWLGLIRNRAAALDDSAIQETPYQMLHRTASACSRLGKRPLVQYEVFRDGNHAVDYAADLKHLADALGPAEVQFWLQEIPLTLTDQYRQTERELSKTRTEDIPRLVRRALWESELFRFGESAFSQIS